MARSGNKQQKPSATVLNGDTNSVPFVEECPQTPCTCDKPSAMISSPLWEEDVVDYVTTLTIPPITVLSQKYRDHLHLKSLPINLLQ